MLSFVKWFYFPDVLKSSWQMLIVGGVFPDPLSQTPFELVSMFKVVKIVSKYVFVAQNILLLELSTQHSTVPSPAFSTWSQIALKESPEFATFLSSAAILVFCFWFWLCTLFIFLFVFLISFFRRFICFFVETFAFSTFSTWNTTIHRSRRAHKYPYLIISDLKD